MVKIKSKQLVAPKLRCRKCGSLMNKINEEKCKCSKCEHIDVIVYSIAY